MAVNYDNDKAVVSLSSKGGLIAAFGFPSVGDAVAFVEKQLSLVNDPSKVFGIIQEVISDGSVIDGVDFRILNTDLFQDLFDEEDEEDELPVAE
ncbi:hypothetical protein ACFY7C_36750 [Streptomyces sp. NPDC012769]|uniref:hypothetical protein n=1 Tax=Streptomyces sp. NPDC012769 TaxID=3364848 RepID=UPI003691F5CA